MNSNTELIIYTTDDGVTKVEATFDGDTVWLSQEQMGELFQRDKSMISRHIRNIFTEGDRKSTRLNSSHSGQSRMPSSA